MIRTIGKVLACALALSSSVFAADAYPRLATYAISSPQDYYDAGYQKELATTSVAILNIWPGWGQGHSTTMNQVAQKVKAINPATRVFVYVRPESLEYPADSVWAEQTAKVNSERWWLYQSALSTMVLSDYGNGHYLLNTSPTSRKDSSGKTYSQWFGSYVGSTFGTPNPALDGIFTDDVFWKPRRDGDWDLNGSLDSQNTASVQAAYRQGMRQYLDSLKKSLPGKLYLANVADWGLVEAVISEYSGQFNGGVFEGMVGRPYSIEKWGSWQQMMTAYRKIMAAFASPKLGVCVQTGALNDYQGMRYGLGSCSLDDGYYAYSNVDDTYHRVPQFDEFKVKLGAAVSGPTTTAWQAGVYRRDFQNGIVLVNPRGNGARTVTLESDFVKVKGTQDPSVNNGQTVRTVTLKDRDGIFLLRQASAVRPNAPSGFSAQ
jgi:hypothetical protein